MIGGLQSFDRHLTTRGPRSAHSLSLVCFALAVLLIVVVLSSTGCEPERQELLLGPRLPVAQTYEGGSWEQIPVLTCGVTITALAAWSPDDVLLAGGGGRVVRVRDGVACNLNLPTATPVSALAVALDGAIYAATIGGYVYRYEAGRWTLDWHAYDGRTPTGLWCSPAGTVTLIGRRGQIVRREDGVWRAVDLGTTADLLDVWGRGEDELWAVGTDGVVAHFDGTNWSLSRPFGSGLRLDKVCGDAEGRIAILHSVQESDANATIYLREESAWEAMPVESGAHVIAFEGGRLLAFTSSQWYLRLNGEWVGGSFWYDGTDDVVVVEAPHPELIRRVGDVLLLADTDGNVIRFQHGDWKGVFAAPSEVTSLAIEPDGVLILAGGQALRQTSAGWVREITPGRELRGPFVRDATGRLVAESEGGIARRSAGGRWEQVPLPFYVQWCYALGDSSLCLISSDAVWVWDGATAARLCSYPGTWGLCRCVAGPDPASTWFLFDRFLARFDGAALVPLLQQTSQPFLGLAYDPTAGVLLYGKPGLYLWDGAGTRDVTPRFESGGDLQRAYFDGITALPNGDLWALTVCDEVMRRVEGEWSVDGRLALPPNGSWGTVVSLATSHLIVHGVNEAYVISYGGIEHFVGGLQGGAGR